MKIIKTAKEMQNYTNGKKIGFVPTMGYLHDGHLSLVKKARQENDCVVVSIFVNPTQFAPNEDYSTYPRDFEKDEKLLKELGVDIIFYPSVKEIYPDGNTISFPAHPELRKKLCGSSRPAHFDGVATVVKLLFDIVRPENSYFGLKDYQQFIIIKDIVKRYNLNTNVISCPTIREKDGLAMSSRNEYLTKEQRKQAAVLYESLKLAKNGEKSTAKIKKIITDKIKQKSEANIDYIEIIDKETLENTKEVNSKTLVALAVKFGKARLIDNMIVG